jgi:hypothetical protein
MKLHFRLVSLLLALAVTALAAELKIGSLNCYLLFDPAIDHRGKVDDANRMTPEHYRAKIANLASLTTGYELVALQEIGGREEVTALAKAARMSWAWTQGKDTATGQDVAVLHNLPGWTVTSKGRIAELDRVVSKHLLVLATHKTERVFVLAVHLLRPIGPQADKQAKQRQAIGAWATSLLAREPGASVVIVGDTNNSDREPLYGVGREAGTLNAFAATHLTNRCYDRIVVTGTGHWTEIKIVKPPYGKKPNETNKRLWTDHFFLGATLAILRPAVP